MLKRRRWAILPRRSLGEGESGISQSQSSHFVQAVALLLEGKESPYYDSIRDTQGNKQVVMFAWQRWMRANRSDGRSSLWLLFFLVLRFLRSYFRIASRDIVYVPVSRKLLNLSFSQDVGAFVVVTNCERAGDLNLHMWKLPVSTSILYTSICPGFASKARMPHRKRIHASSFGSKYALLWVLAPSTTSLLH